MVRLSLYPEPRDGDRICPVGALFADLTILPDGRLVGDAGRWVAAMLAQHPGSEVRIHRQVSLQVGASKLVDGVVETMWAREEVGV